MSDFSRRVKDAIKQAYAGFQLWYQLGLVALFVMLLTGCAKVEDRSLTFRVWDTDEWCKFSEPAPNPNLALFETNNGAVVLVQYGAFSEKRSTVQRRAYYVHPNQARLNPGTKPDLVKPSVADGMKPIPVLPAPAALTNQPPEPSSYAVVTKEGRGFALFRPLESESTFDLPVYAETSGTPTRIVLTPFAVAGDTVMVGVVAAVVGFVAWAHIGAPTYWWRVRCIVSMNASKANSGGDEKPSATRAFLGNRIKPAHQRKVMNTILHTLKTLFRQRLRQLAVPAKLA